MSKLVKRTEKDRKLSEKIQNILTDWGVQHSVRKCYTPKYGDDAYILEEWSNEAVADLIVDEMIKTKLTKGTI